MNKFIISNGTKKEDHNLEGGLTIPLQPSSLSKDVLYEIRMSWQCSGLK